jgi:hypothetical protein
MPLPGPTPTNSLVISTTGDVDTDGDPDVVFVRAETFGLRTQSFLNQAITGPGTPGTGGVPASTIGPAVLGNPMFSLSFSTGVPGAVAALGISLGTAAVGTLPYVIWLDLSPTQLLWPSGGNGVFTTDSAGQVFLPVPLPNSPSLGGAEVYTQWIVDDPNGAYPIGTRFYALSEARKIVIF